MLILASLATFAMADEPVTVCEVKESKDPINDARTVISTCVNKGGFRRSTPVLMLRCVGGRTEVAIDWDDFVDNEDVRVTTRIDDDLSVSSVWGISTGHTATFAPGNDKERWELAKSIVGRKFAARVVPYGENVATEVWQVSSEVGQVVEACAPPEGLQDVAVKAVAGRFVGSRGSTADTVFGIREQALLACLRTKDDKAALPASVGVQLTIGEGKVGAVAMKSNDFPSWAVGECVKDMISRWEFPQSVEGVGEWSVTYRVPAPPPPEPDAACETVKGLVAAGVPDADIVGIIGTMDNITPETVGCAEASGFSDAIKQALVARE